MLFVLFLLFFSKISCENNQIENVQDVVVNSNEIEAVDYGGLNAVNDGRTTNEGSGGFASGVISVDCLRCICLHDSKCQDMPCRVAEGMLYCGYFQLRKDHWIDCGKLDSDWKTCAHNVTCSSLCLQKYMKIYVDRYNCPPNCEGYSREHKGGPNGCNIPGTLDYWNAVQQQPGCKGVR